MELNKKVFVRADCMICVKCMKPVKVKTTRISSMMNHLFTCDFSEYLRVGSELTKLLNPLVLTNVVTMAPVMVTEDDDPFPS